MRKILYPLSSKCPRNYWTGSAYSPKLVQKGPTTGTDVMKNRGHRVQYRAAIWECPGSTFPPIFLCSLEALPPTCQILAMSRSKCVKTPAQLHAPDAEMHPCAPTHSHALEQGSPTPGLQTGTGLCHLAEVIWTLSHGNWTFLLGWNVLLLRWVAKCFGLRGKKSSCHGSTSRLLHNV